MIRRARGGDHSDGRPRNEGLPAAEISLSLSLSLLASFAVETLTVRVGRELTGV